MEKKEQNDPHKLLADRVSLNQPVSGCVKIWGLAGQMEDVVSLGIGTPSFNTPKNIRDAVIEELNNNPNIGKYTPFPGLPELRKLLAKEIEKNGAQSGVKVDWKKEVYVTSGAMEGVTCAIMAIVNPGDEVIILQPCFMFHFKAIHLARGIPVYVDLIEEDNWEVDVQAVKEAITEKTKAIIISTPANPTGSVYSEENLRKIGDLVLKHNLVVITDDPYQFLVYDNKPFFSLSHVPELHQNRICCYSFSKEFAMTGFRIGYIYTNHTFMSHMYKIHNMFVVCAARTSQMAAIAALKGPRDYIKEFKEEFAKRRALFCKYLDQMPQLFKYQKPKGAFYVFVKLVPEIDDKAFAMKLLKEAKVIVVPGSDFGKAGAGHVRLAFAGEQDTIHKAMKRIVSWWNQSQLNPLKQKK